MKHSIYYLFIIILYPLSLISQESRKLNGTIIGTELSVDYTTNYSSRTVNTCKDAFDGNLSTFFASYDRSNTWCGLDLGSKHVITRIGWSPRNTTMGQERVVLAVFEGANEPDFSDAIPLYMNDTQGVIGQYQYADVNVSRAFRYVRYIGPNNARCNIAEVEFYGYESEGEEGTYYRPTNLPLVVVHTVDAVEPFDKVNDIVCTVTLIPSSPNDTIKTKSGSIRLRGNGSNTFPKKPYRIKFDKKHHVFGSPASAKKWTLINNYGDKTLMRNILAFDISRRLGMEYTPYCKSVDVMLNGEYKGNYQLSDQVEVNKNRVAIETMSPEDIAGDALTGGYLIEVDAYAAEEANHFYSYKNNPVTIKYPDSDEITPEQTAYIRDFFNKMEQSLYSYNYTTENGYRRYLDLTSFLRHFIVGELSGNTDTYWSTYMYKHRGEDKFYVGPVWDFDLAFENDNRTYPINNNTDYIYNTKGSYAGNMRQFVSRIVKNDQAAIKELEDIWADARINLGLSASNLNAYVDENAENLQQSQRLNFMRWQILNQRVHQNWQASGSYDKEVDIVKNYIINRFDWLDRKLKFNPLGIEDHTTPISKEDILIYSIDGIAMGTDINTLPKGIYIRNGKKFIVK